MRRCVLCGSSANTIRLVISEMQTMTLGSNTAAMRELELASILSSRVASLKALRERIKPYYGVAVLLLLSRCVGVLEFVAEELRKPNVNRPRPGMHAARCVSLRFQANELQRLQARLRPTQTAACCSPNIV